MIMFYTVSLPCLLYLDHYVEYSNNSNSNDNDNDNDNSKSYPSDTLIIAVNDDIISLESLIRVLTSSSRSSTIAYYESVKGYYYYYYYYYY